jgi:phage gp29-like protein
MKTLFSSYPDISDMLINKVIFDTKDEEDMQVFFDSLSSVNEENKK